MTKSTAIQNSTTTMLIVDFTGCGCATTTTAKPTVSAANSRKTASSISVDPREGQRRRSHQHDQRDGQQDLPAEAHQLVVAEARERRPHPDVEEHQEGDLAEEDGEAGEDATPGVGQLDARQRPAAEVERGEHH